MPDTLRREDEIDKRAEDLFNHPDYNELKDLEKKAVSDHESSASSSERNEVLSKEESGNWQNNTSSNTTQPQGNLVKRAKGSLRLNKKKGATVGVLGGFGLIGIFFTLLAPSSLLISLTENLIANNNGAESAYQKRIVKVLGSKLSDADGLCDTKKVKCKMGRISVKGIKKLEAKGVVALDADGNKVSNTDSKYPDKKITQYKIEGFDNPVRAGEMKNFLVSEPKIAAKLLGRSGAFNLRFEMWRGKYINKTMFSKWKNISRNGGVADGENKRGATATETLAKVKEQIPGVDGLKNQAGEKIKAKTDKLVDKGKKGGVGYLTAVGSCIGVKAPGIIASGVAAVQLARVLPLSSNLVMSPGSKNKASMFSNINADDVSAAATTLTDTDSNGKSALDSKYLQSAIGTNKNKTGPSSDFSPGYSVLTNSTIRSIKNAEVKSEGACNAVLSPQAMYTAAAADAAITVAASATIVGGLAKVAVSYAIGKGIERIITSAIEGTASEVIESLAKNDKLDKVLSGERGEKLGDALGISAMTFFSVGGAAKHTPVLKESQLTAYNEEKVAQDEFQRSMDLASLSPFDTSSKYTFLGSIINNFNMAAISGGGYITSSTLSYLINPLKTLSATANAASYDTNYCGYASDFKMDTDDGSSPAVNAAGLPCYGYTGNISTESALSITEGKNSDGESWINDEGSDGVNEDADIDEIAKDDTRLKEYLDGCGSTSIESGEWTDAAAGCTINTNSSPSKQIPGNSKPCTKDEDPDTTGCFDNTEGISESITKSSGPDESEAVAAFAMDYQLSQTIDGNDEESFAGTSDATDTTIMTYNIGGLNEKVQGGDSARAVVELAKQKNIGIIALQEARDSQLTIIDQGLGSNFARYSEATRSIYYRTDLYSLVDKGLICGPKASLNTDCNKMAWVKLLSKASQKEFYVTSIHPDVDSAANRKKTAENTLKELGSKSDPIIIAGDMNEDKGGDVYDTLTTNGFVYAQNIAQQKINDDCESANNKDGQDCGKSDPKIIDHIYISDNANATVSKWENVKDNSSDHNPIVVSLSIPGITSGGGAAISGDFAWPLGEKDWKANKGAYTKGHTGTGTAWGSDPIGTSNKGAGIASDIGASVGTPVYAMFGGEVTSTSLCGSNDGIAIKSNINGGTLGVAYMHGQNKKFKTGDTVQAGQQIMEVGTIGCNVFGAHLHIGVAYNGKYVCPQDVFIAKGTNQTLDFNTLVSKGKAPCSRFIVPSQKSS